MPNGLKQLTEKQLRESLEAARGVGVSATAEEQELARRRKPADRAPIVTPGQLPTQPQIPRQPQQIVTPQVDTAAQLRRLEEARTAATIAGLEYTFFEDE